MTEQELDVLEKSRELWDEFLKLPVIHPDDQNEFRLHLHAIQNIVMARTAMKAMSYKMNERWGGEPLNTSKNALHK